MLATRHSVEQIIAKLREVEKPTGQEMTVPIAARKVGTTDQTFYGRGIRYGAQGRQKSRQPRQPQHPNR
jgi:hypothetical protein